MDKILSINTIKNVFAALGAKTSDSNYGVALLDKTTAEPKGLMGISDLATVMGVNALHGNPAVIKGGEIPANTTTVLNYVTGGLLFIGAYSSCSVYFCEYWSTTCTKIIGVADHNISKSETSANVTVVNGQYDMNWFFIGF